MKPEIRYPVFNATRDGRITAAEASAYIGVPEKTMANWRSLERGPAYFKVGGAVTYRLADLDEFVASNCIKPATSGGRERALVRPRTG